MKRIGKIVLFGVLALTLCGCLPGSHGAAAVGSGGWLAHLMLGFWHGMVAPLTFAMEMASKFAPDFVRSLPYGLWGPWYAFDSGEAGFAYNMGFCFGLFFLPSFVFVRPRILQ